jgi:hypothetical protein
MKQILLFVTVVVLVVLVPGILLAQSNPSIGTWKLTLRPPIPKR